MNKIAPLLLLLGSIGVAQVTTASGSDKATASQNAVNPDAVTAAATAVATSGSGQTTPLVPHPAVVTFVASNANSTAGALKNAAGGRAIAAVGARAVPVPVFGGLIAEQAVGRIVKVFHKAKPINGFNIAFVKGLSAGTALQKGAVSFTVPAQVLHGASPLLLRLKPSVKDSARIARSVRISTKPTGSAINPAESSILGVDQDAIACRQEIRNGDVVLIPNSPLVTGEYAIVLVSAQPDKVPVVGAALWDFRLL